MLPPVCFALPRAELGVAGELVAVSVGIYLVLVSAGRLLKYRLGTRLGSVYQLFCAVMGPYLAIIFFAPWLLRYYYLGRHLGAAAVLLATGVFVRLLDQYFWSGYLEGVRRATVPKFIREVASIFIVLVVFLLVLQIDYGYGKELPGLVGASGVGAIILGFALQDLLGNIIAGFAVQIGRPFQVGDWLFLDGQHVKAVEINWRSTRFVTNDEVQLDVPNQQIIRGTIVNYHGGGSLHGMRFEIGIEYDAPPNKVRDILVRATAAAPGVLAEPAPYAFLKDFGDSAVIYQVRFWLDDHRLYNMMSDAVHTNIWYALHREHINVPFPIRTLQIDRARPRAGADRRRDPREVIRELLRGQRLFQSMGDDYLQLLIDRSHLHRYGIGEAIIREGADGASMFVLVTGEAGVTVTNGGQPTRVATLRRGDCFGEMSLLTGEQRSASVHAIIDCEVLEITKPVFADIIQKDADLLPRLSDLLAARQLETDDIVQSRANQPALIAAKEEEYRAGFLHKLKSFFEL